jgi:hypothetical protein
MFFFRTCYVSETELTFIQQWEFREIYISRTKIRYIGYVGNDEGMEKNWIGQISIKYVRDKRCIKFLAGRCEGKIQLAVPRSRRKDNIKITLNDILLSGRISDRCQSQSPANMVKNFVLHRVCSVDQLSNYYGSTTMFHGFT